MMGKYKYPYDEVFMFTCLYKSCGNCTFLDSAKLTGTLSSNVVSKFGYVKDRKVHWFGQFFILEISPTTVKIIDN